MNIATTSPVLMEKYVSALGSKSVLNEAKAPAKFDDSTDATDFFEAIQTSMKAPALMDWAKETDSNYDSSAVKKLKAAIAAYDAFVNELYTAD